MYGLYGNTPRRSVNKKKEQNVTKRKFNKFLLKYLSLLLSFLVENIHHHMCVYELAWTKIQNYSFYIASRVMNAWCIESNIIRKLYAYEVLIYLILLRVNISTIDVWMWQFMRGIGCKGTKYFFWKLNLKDSKRI